VESYPQLKATEAFRDLMTQLEGTENRIATSRKDYNDRVKEFNQLVSLFPRNIVASMFGFAPEKYFESVAGSEVAPEVKF
jgi:LemA protein